MVLILLMVSSLLSCGTKKVQIWNAQANAKMTEVDFVNLKMQKLTFLNLSDGQKNQCTSIFKNEKLRLGQINIDEPKEIAPVLYDAEISFRKVLTSDQLTEYKNATEDKVSGYFLTDKAMSELKKAYNL